jgi:hypothetical protein
MDSSSEDKVIVEAFGYEVDSQATRPARLEELTLRANPATLRALSTFLLQVAGLIEQHGEAFGHEHFRDFVGANFEGADVIAVAPKR